MLNPGTYTLPVLIATWRQTSSLISQTIESLCVCDVFEIARALVAPLAAQAAPWDMLQEKLKARYAPKPSKIASRHAFYHRNQAEGEPINTYVAALWKATLQCEFSDLDDTLLDKIISDERSGRTSKLRNVQGGQHLTEKSMKRRKQTIVLLDWYRPMHV
ncbi:hypothetical protein JRQ81_013811 [Phrynocephalus forsythii]|uniref:Retrotransposon gag domain-containing protein n=1 Tax=Phrynocephalus forsythii TaxID=171643 RepID=A0A9Q0XZW6_9SAUR|nr:hypothetical protein JRQ81_013811 [Phrynocephalus forsythii]